MGFFFTPSLQDLKSYWDCSECYGGPSQSRNSKRLQLRLAVFLSKLNDQFPDLPAGLHIIK